MAYRECVTSNHPERIMDAVTTGAGIEGDAGSGEVSGGAARARPTHSLLDALMPANPPQPKNARVVRLFDYEAGRMDAPAPLPVEPAREPDARETARAARRLSLSAAAGLS